MKNKSKMTNDEKMLTFHNVAVLTSFIMFAQLGGRTLIFLGRLFNSPPFPNKKIIIIILYFVTIIFSTFCLVTALKSTEYFILRKKVKDNDFIPDDVDINIRYKELCLNLKEQGYWGASKIAKCSELMTRVLIKLKVL